ncbi:NUDIX domain-containing protein [Streptococcus caballi]|uniref:NUDIX domain-containing protein n=1 Tax=Streptococcus caballi TaxID=439220 RepID=UPI00037B6DB4|nr:NUDIX domain-containing protein [Streptococcus caballi]
MHRARNKATFPDYFEATAGGAALCRETSEGAARRESKEELEVDQFLLLYKQQIRKITCISINI